MPEPDSPRASECAEKHAREPDRLESGDYYFEGQYLVFTAAYHRRRGYCCNSGCRHCPWREQQEAGSSTPDHARRGSNAAE